MKISVIIPMYNSKTTIVRTLESVKNQTMINKIHEIIIVNDGSTDGSLEIVENYHHSNAFLPIKIINKKNGGVSSARNMGMRKSTGDWLAFLDSDDEWISIKIERQIEILERNSEIDFLGGDVNEFGLKILWRKIDKLYKANIKDICLKNFPQPSTVIFKKAIFDEIGGFDEKQKYAEDGNYFLKICDKYNLFYLPELLIVYDGGKREFGVKGLSSNLLEMYKGNLKNIKELRTDNKISVSFYIFLRSFYWIKYLRRIIITKLLNK